MLENSALFIPYINCLTLDLHHFMIPLKYAAGLAIGEQVNKYQPNAAR
jgi:hypothetical protein